MIKYRRMSWGHQSLWDLLSHPISSSALIPVLLSPHRSWTRPFLIQAKVGFNPNQDKNPIHREFTLYFYRQVWYRSCDAFWNEVCDLLWWKQNLFKVAVVFQSVRHDQTAWGNSEVMEEGLRGWPVLKKLTCKSHSCWLGHSTSDGS